MKIQISDYFNNMDNTTRDTFCEMLGDPTLWSDTMIKDTLKLSGSHPFNIEDVRHIVRDYLKVLSEKIETRLHLIRLRFQTTPEY